VRIHGFDNRLSQSKQGFSHYEATTHRQAGYLFQSHVSVSNLSNRTSTVVFAPVQRNIESDHGRSLNQWINSDDGISMDKSQRAYDFKLTFDRSDADAHCWNGLQLHDGDAL
jgi:hypothetical protein